MPLVCQFVLVAADHPIVSALSENADRLQMGEISMMPVRSHGLARAFPGVADAVAPPSQEGLVKISSSLYEAVMPMVRTQVASQIKVRDMSSASVSIAPAEFSGWNEARSELMAEAKSRLQARLEVALTNMKEGEADDIRAKFMQEERDLEHDVDHTVHTFTAKVDIGYNFLSR